MIPLLLLALCIVVIVSLAIHAALIERALSHEREVSGTLRMALNNPPVYKDKCHADKWNGLWDRIRLRFNIYRQGNQWHGGQPALEIYKTLRSEFGKFDEQQIDTMTRLFTLLAQAQEQQREYAAAMNPIDKDIVFDGEGGYKVISKIKPSNN